MLSGVFLCKSTKQILNGFYILPYTYSDTLLSPVLATLRGSRLYLLTNACRLVNTEIMREERKVCCQFICRLAIINGLIGPLSCCPLFYFIFFLSIFSQLLIIVGNILFNKAGYFLLANCKWMPSEQYVRRDKTLTTALKMATEGMDNDALWNACCLPVGGLSN